MTKQIVMTVHNKLSTFVKIYIVMVTIAIFLLYAGLTIIWHCVVNANLMPVIDLNQSSMNAPDIETLAYAKKKQVKHHKV